MTHLYGPRHDYKCLTGGWTERPLPSRMESGGPDDDSLEEKRVRDFDITHHPLAVIRIRHV